ncbi:MAG: hypothetical protein AAGD11_16770, partial [Planctomycetota bacterium]
MKLHSSLLLRASALGFCSITMCCLATASPESTTADSPTITAARIGFDGAFKLGCWSPLTIELAGGDESWQGQVLVTAPDTDGVPTQVRKPVVVEAGKPQTIPFSVRVGQSRCPITVTLVAASKGVVAERQFYLGEHQTDGIPGGYPSTNRILLECGASLELEALISAELITEEHLATRVANVQNPLDLPTEW